MLKKLNVGCGLDYREGWVNADRNDSIRCDSAFDFEKDFPFKDEEFDFIYCRHVLEHIFNTVGFMNECYRILKPEGKMEIIVPKAGTHAFFRDPTHHRQFVMATFTYFTSLNNFCPAYGIKNWSGIEILEEKPEMEQWKEPDGKVQTIENEINIIHCILIK